MSLYKQLDQAVQHVMGKSAPGIIRRGVNFAKLQKIRKDDFPQFLSVFKGILDESDLTALKQAEEEIFMSMQRVHAKAHSE